MESVIVTGGTGFLGRNMIRYLCNKGYKVYAVVRPDSKNSSYLPKHENVHPVYCNLSDIHENKALNGRSYDAFYHFAWGGVNRDQIDNEVVQQHSMEESLKALESAMMLNCGCFIFSGSRSEYGLLKGKFREDMECRPQVAYGRKKLEFGSRARQLCKDADMQYIHARIFSVYGADDHPWSLIYTAITKMMKNEPMDLSACTQLWNFMDVRDMADLFLTFQKEKKRIPADNNCVFNVATDDIRPLREFVEEIYRITGSKSELRFGSFHQAAESAMSILPDMTKVEETFGWKQRIPFSEGIQEVIRGAGQHEA